jgi:hypothetical protein
MKILNRDELDEQRKNYVRYIDVLKKLDVRVQDGSLTDKEVRDATFTIHSRLLAFILSELLHLSQILRVMEDQIEIEFSPEMEDEIEDEFYDPLIEEIQAAEEEAGFISADEALKTLDEIDAEGQDEARRMMDDLHRKAEQIEDEESD